MKYTALVRKGEKQYVALCPELDVVSQGHTEESAIKNLKEAVELFLEDQPYGTASKMKTMTIEVENEAATPVGV